MTRPMVIKWLKWIKNCLIAGSEPEEAIDFAIDSLEVDEFYNLTYESTRDVTPEEHEVLNESLNKISRPTGVNETIDFAIDTMRKYQKIKQIAFPLQYCSTAKLEHDAIMKICEVIEDGNVD